MAKPEIVYVEWIDSCSAAASVWNDRKHAKNLNADLCQSIGFLLADRKDEISIASHLGSDQVSGHMTIPRVAIKKLKRLSARKRKK